MSTSSTNPATDPATDAQGAAYSLKALSHQMEKLAALEAKLTGREPDGTFVAQAKAASLGIFRLIVMGEIKKGKSSFINALTGIRDLVPVHSDVATSTIYKIHYGKELRYTVYFEPSAGRDRLPISKDEIASYGTEDGNPDNRKGVDFIRVEAPSPILHNGLVIVDTPGVGGLFKQHRAITFKHAPNADAVFFVTESVGAPIGAEEVSFLKELRSVTPLVYFVQTKACDANVETRTARMKNNLDILIGKAGIPEKEVSYFIIDSTMKLNADQSKSTKYLALSGFEPLMRFLNNSLRKNHEQKVGRLAIERSSAKLAVCDSELNARRAVLDAGTKEEMDELEAAIRKQRDDLKRWDRETKPRLIADFQKSLSTLRRSALEKIAAFRPGGPFHQEAEVAIFGAPDVAAIQALMAAASSNLPAAVSKACLATGDEITAGVKRLVEKLAAEAGSTQAETFSLHIPGAATGDIAVITEALRRVAERDRAGQTFDTMRTVAYGGLAGGTIAMCIGSILGSVVPVVGTMIGSTIGLMVASAWGAKTSFDMKREQELEVVRREASAALSQSLSSTHYEAQKAVERIFEEVQTAATDGLQRIVREATDRLGSQNEELQKRRQSSQADVARKRKELTVLMKEAESLRAALATARATI
jgi:hypothetical protein